MESIRRVKRRHKAEKIFSTFASVIGKTLLGTGVISAVILACMMDTEGDKFFLILELFILSMAVIAAGVAVTKLSD